MLIENPKIKIALIALITIAIVYVMNNKNIFTSEGYDVMENLEGDDPVEFPEREDPDVGDEGLSSMTNDYDEEVRGDRVNGVSPKDDTNDLSVFNKTDELGHYRATVEGTEELKSLVHSKEDISRKRLEKGYDELMPPNPKLIDDDVKRKFSSIDLRLAELRLDHDNLINTDRYTIGVNTVGSSNKLSNYDIRPRPPNPKFTITPWNNSTIEPDYNTRPL